MMEIIYGLLCFVLVALCIGIIVFVSSSPVGGRSENNEH